MRDIEEFDGIERQNHESFDVLVEERLKRYVYVLRDPSDKRIFYVGKGGGNLNGNSRILAHFQEAEDWLKGARTDVPSDKVRTILSIWRNENSVEWFIVRHGLETDELAIHIEAALIDVLPLGGQHETRQY